MNPSISEVPSFSSTSSLNFFEWYNFASWRQVNPNPKICYLIRCYTVLFERILNNCWIKVIPYLAFPFHHKSVARWPHVTLWSWRVALMSVANLWANSSTCNSSTCFVPFKGVEWRCWNDDGTSDMDGFNIQLFNKFFVF